MGEVFRDDFWHGSDSYETLNYQNVTTYTGLTGGMSYVILNGSTQVTKFDVEASNGVVHEIGSVLQYMDVECQNDLTYRFKKNKKMHCLHKKMKNKCKKKDKKNKNTRVRDHCGELCGKCT